MRGRVRRMWKHNALQHERFRDQATVVLGPDVEPMPVAVAPPRIPARGGVSQHPQWFQVLALVKGPDGIDSVFLAEYPKPHQAVMAASVYPFRAIVVNKHSKQEFDNQKRIEGVG